MEMLVKYDKVRKWLDSSWIYHCSDPRASDVLGIYYVQSKKNLCTKGSPWIRSGATLCGGSTFFLMASIQRQTSMETCFRVLSCTVQVRKSFLAKPLPFRNYVETGCGSKIVFLSNRHGKEVQSILCVSDAKLVQLSRTCTTKCKGIQLYGQLNMIWPGSWWIKCHNNQVTEL